MIDKKRVATIWLDGCSGCHMSFLDMDELLIDLSELIDLVYGPLVDFKDIPPDIDIALIEGAISSDEDLEKAKCMRANSKLLISFGDCAVAGNVPSMRNTFPVKDVMKRAYEENASHNQSLPDQSIPTLLPQARPVHEYVKVDVFIPGCPPSAAAIHAVLVALLNGETPNISEMTRFGA